MVYSSILAQEQFVRPFRFCIIPGRNQVVPPRTRGRTDAVAFLEAGKHPEPERRYVLSVWATIAESEEDMIEAVYFITVFRAGEEKA